MGKKRKKRYFTREEREALRTKAEAERKGFKSGFSDPPPGLRRPKKAPNPREVPAGPMRSRRLDPDRLVTGVPFRLRGELKDRAVLLFETVLAHRPGLVEEPYRMGLVSLIWGTWLQNPRTWRPRGKGLATAYRSLLAHVLGRYRISSNLWDTTLLDVGPDRKVMKRAIAFVGHLARGESPRELVGTHVLPAPLTRRMLHILTKPPRPMRLVPMVRRAQVLGYGGSEALSRCLETTRLGSYKCSEPYWADVIHWLCRQSDLDQGDVGPIIDFLDQRFKDGEPLRLKGRTVPSLRRMVRDWHAGLAQIELFGSRMFEQSGFSSGQWTTTVKVHGESVPYEHWRMTEILTAKDLVREGRMMRHCVASYQDKVISGRTSIWSLTCDGRRKVTVEVDNLKGAVVQAQGHANSRPTGPACRRIRAWSRDNNLAVLALQLN